MHFGIVLRHIGLHEGVIGDSEGQSVQTLELKLVERIGSENNRVNGLTFLLDRLNVLIESLSLLLFKFFKDFRAFAKLDELASERGHLARVNGVENEMHDTAVSALDQTRLLTSSLLRDHRRLNSCLFLAEGIELLRDNAIEQGARVTELLCIGEHRAQELIFISNGQLVSKTVTPV